jgi:hypothetical protein
MKVKTSELQGAALNWAVAKCEGDDTLAVYFDERSGEPLCHDDWPDNQEFKPSTDWAQGGPIIEREKIGLFKGNPLYFPEGNENGDYYEDLWIAGKYHGQTPLIAAMRCYVSSKLGDEVEVPDEMAT